MYIPINAVIASEKLTQYLLIPRPKNDKSKWLASIGFSLDNAEALETALRQVIELNEATEDHRDEYGIFYHVAGKLVGPLGELEVITVWVREAHDESIFRFITLKPRREKS
ncbi:MAG: hypothetical protein K8L91_07455 [Anaerolineae bacterium]|nr:hypothetical protein [Anaerolineae bacterium]